MASESFPSPWQIKLGVFLLHISDALHSGIRITPGEDGVTMKY
jgi:hypothetical protein